MALFIVGGIDIRNMTVQDWLGADNQLGIDIWERKYRKNGETFSDFLDRVSNGNPRIRSLMEQKRFLPGGRIMSNIGVPNSSSGMSNCFSRGFVEDSYDDIMQAAVDIGKTFKAQGGQGLSLSKLRPKGTPIGTDYESDGIIPFMKIYNEVTEGTSQGGARKGALLISLDAWHAEALNFITIKSKDGLIEKANLSLEIDNEFMEAVDAYYKTGEVITVTRHACYSGHDVEWEVTPIEVYKAMIKNNWSWGDPGCLFVDRFRTYNLMEFVDDYQIETCNPSLRKGTLILTRDGVVPIEQLEGKTFEVQTLNGTWAPAECFLSGRNQPLYEVELDGGIRYHATKEHRWPVLHNGDYTKFYTEDLRPGDLIPFTQNAAFPFGDQGSYDDGRLLGCWYGGRFTSARCDDEHLKGCMKRFGISDPYALPEGFMSTLSENFRKGFVDGLFSAGGHLTDREGVPSLSLLSCSAEWLEQVRGVLWWYGIRSAVAPHTASASETEQQGYELICQGEAAVRFAQAFHLSHVQKQAELERIAASAEQTKSIDHIRVTGVKRTGLSEDVWDIHVYDSSHTFRIGACITGNCGEQPLNKHGACNLSSLNLSEFVVDPYTEQAFFDLNSFVEAVHDGIVYLDSIIDLNAPRYALPQQRENALRFRNSGLGVFGYATALMKLGLTYGSPKAIEFTDNLFREMFRAAVMASSFLAAEKGPFPAYDERIWDSSIVKKHFTPEEIKALKQSGLRNCSVLSIAPTGSIATLLGESGGAEPEFAISYTRRTVGLTGNTDSYYQVYCKAAREYMARNRTDKLPGWFVSSADIDPMDRVETQAVMQNHVDTAISSTVNLPEYYTEEQMGQIYLQAWKRGLKGLTIFRSGCARTAILTAAPEGETGEEKEKVPVLQRGDIICCEDKLPGIKKKLVTGCGTMHLQVYYDPQTGDILETFVSRGSTGGCEKNQEAVSRLMSLSLRGGIALEDIIDQLMSCPGCSSYHASTVTRHDTSKGSSCPTAIAYALRELQNEIYETVGDQEEPDALEQEDLSPALNEEGVQGAAASSVCPECGGELRFEGGCNLCPACGWSKCS